MKTKRDIADYHFTIIAKELGVSELTAQNAYNSGMRKIRRYLLKNKQLRYELQEWLEYLEFIKNKENKRDISFKSED